MDALWLHNKQRPNLIVFCNGWGMDEQPFRPLLTKRCDVLILSDYRGLEPVPDIVDLARNYADVYLVAWSMGVWVGQRLFSGLRHCFRETVAINGTLCPIHDAWGIPEEILLATLRNYSTESRQKLYRRMCRDRELLPLFQAHLPSRGLEDQHEELEVLLEMCDCLPARGSIYSRILVADKDLVMPTANQLEFWRTERPRRFAGYHFPFYRWPSWDALLAEALQDSISANPRMEGRG